VNNPKVSIIILNWNGYKDTIECLESLKKIDYQNYEIIIVDNGSSGDDVKILRDRFGDYIHIIANVRNEGFPGGCNIGMQHALQKGTDYILLLNNDTIVDPQFLTELVKVTESDAIIGMAGSKMYFYRHPSQIQSAGGKINWWSGIITYLGMYDEDIGQYDNLAERDFLFGTSLLLKKIVVDTISFMDTAYFFGIEELDYCTRAKRAGFKILYVPTSKVWHKVGASASKLPQYKESQKMVEKSQGVACYKHNYRLFRTYGPPVLFIFPFFLATAVSSLPGQFVKYAVRGDWQRINAGIRKRLRKPVTYP
jgi:GT2 family glycosyltransferase